MNCIFSHQLIIGKTCYSYFHALHLYLSTTEDGNCMVVEMVRISIKVSDLKKKKSGKYT